MSLSAASIPLGATSFTPVGGSATSFSSLGQNPGTNELVLEDGYTDLLLRNTALATAKKPVANAGAPNGFTQQRSTIVFHRPKLLANGEYTTNSVRVEVAFDPETTVAERESLIEMIAHVGTDADFVGLMRDGSVA